MKVLSFVLIILVFGLVAFLKYREKVKGDHEDRSGEVKGTYKAKQVLSQNEQKYYWALVKALPNHAVLAQVALSSFLEVKASGESSHYSLFGKVSQKRADFVICDKAFNVLAVIEIDDSTHKNRKEKDEERDSIVMSAGIKTFRWDINTPNEEKTRNLTEIVSSKPKQAA